MVKGERLARHPLARARFAPWTRRSDILTRSPGRRTASCAGHPWVYDNEIARADGPAASGLGGPGLLRPGPLPRLGQPEPRVPRSGSASIPGPTNPGTNRSPVEPWTTALAFRRRVRDLRHRKRPDRLRRGRRPARTHRGSLRRRRPSGRTEARRAEPVPGSSLQVLASGAEARKADILAVLARRPRTPTGSWSGATHRSGSGKVLPPRSASLRAPCRTGSRSGKTGFPST
ncbi:MAG: hypothetical protein MZV70_69780 [Desulfobacterales bacterium]|nr:hypothetical protein [Desulfobacterales bacterium]